MDANGAGGKRRARRCVVRRQQAIKAAAFLERLPGAAGDDGQIVGGITEPGAFPVDHRDRADGREVRKQALREEIAAQDDRWPGRQVGLDPFLGGRRDRILGEDCRRDRGQGRRYLRRAIRTGANSNGVSRRPSAGRVPRGSARRLRTWRSNPAQSARPATGAASRKETPAPSPPWRRSGTDPLSSAGAAHRPHAPPGGVAH